MTQRKKLGAVIGMGLALLVGSVVLSKYFEIVPTQAEGKTSIVDNQFQQEVGQVAMRDGIKTLSFKYRNTTGGPITVRQLYTSCMCTKARMTVNGKTSAFAGMKGHQGGLAPINPQMTIGPNETALIDVEFDPNAHGPEGTGPFTRQITLETNSPTQPSLQFVFSGVVVR